MNFADWLRGTRERRELDIRGFSQIIGVDSSTISRIENERVEPTLPTISRICENLRISIHELYQQLQSDGDVATSSLGALEVRNSLTFDDVAGFLNTYRNDPERGRHILAEHLNAGFGVARGRAAGGDFPKPLSQEAFTPQAIKQMLQPKHQFFDFSIQYPANIHPAVYRGIYRTGGVLSLEDMGFYLKTLRDERAFSPEGLTDRISANVLSRLETARAEYIKLRDILALDEVFDHHGELLAMYSHALKYLAFLEAREQPQEENAGAIYEDEMYSESDLAGLLLRAYRWLQFYSRQVG